MREEFTQQPFNLPYNVPPGKRNRTRKDRCNGLNQVTVYPTQEPLRITQEHSKQTRCKLQHDKLSKVLKCKNLGTALMNFHKMTTGVVTNITEGHREWSRRNQPRIADNCLFLVSITLNLYILLALHSRHCLFIQIFMMTYISCIK
jgi:hypothetical protein